MEYSESLTSGAIVASVPRWVDVIPLLESYLENPKSESLSVPLWMRILSSLISLCMMFYECSSLNAKRIWMKIDFLCRSVIWELYWLVHYARVPWLQYSMTIHENYGSMEISSMNLTMKGLSSCFITDISLANNSRCLPVNNPFCITFTATYCVSSGDLLSC